MQTRCDGVMWWLSRHSPPPAQHMAPSPCLTVGTILSASNRNTKVFRLADLHFLQYQCLSSLYFTL